MGAARCLSPRRQFCRKLYKPPRRTNLLVTYPKDGTQAASCISARRACRPEYLRRELVDRKSGYGVGARVRRVRHDVRNRHGRSQWKARVSDPPVCDALAMARVSEADHDAREDFG